MNSGLLSSAAALMTAAGLTGLAAGARTTSPVDVSHRARALQPGEAVLVIVSSARPIERVTASAFGQPVPFFATDGSSTEWRGLAGIDVETTPGSYPVRIMAISEEGPSELSHPLQVEPKAFATRRLTVDPSFVNPPAGELQRIQAEAAQLAAVLAIVSPDPLWHGRFQAPVPGPATGRYGELSLFNGEPRSRHRGTDFRAPTGTPVLAPARGRVVLSADLYFAGGSVVLDHGLGVFSHLAHLSSRSVEAGVIVGAGHIVGRSGATGRVTGPHLHWSARIGGASIDPLSLLSLLSDAR